MNLEEIKQDIFNKMWERAKVQTRSVDEEGCCVYRNDDGNCCFVGACIPDSNYSEELENKRAAVLVRDYGLKIFGYDLVIADRYTQFELGELFLNECQAIHDRESPKRWQDQLRDVANSHKLEVPE